MQKMGVQALDRQGRVRLLHVRYRVFNVASVLRGGAGNQYRHNYLRAHERIYYRGDVEGFGTIY